MNKTTISLKHPTPNWVRIIIRTIGWTGGIFAFLLTIGLDLQDFGVPEALNFKILKYMSMAYLAASAIGRMIGVEPVKIDATE